MHILTIFINKRYNTNYDSGKGDEQMKKSLEKKLVNKIINAARYTVDNTVGKSYPIAVHEVKMPDSVRKEFLKKD